MNKDVRIGIIHLAYLDIRCVNEENIDNSIARVMDKYTKSMLTLARKLYKAAAAENIVPDRLGVVAATRTGPFKSVKEYHVTLTDRGYISVNPSKFPNIMMSTSLSHTSIDLNARGPCVPLFLTDNRRPALQYGVIQIMIGRCDAMLVLYVDEERDGFGLFLESERSALNRGENIRFYVDVLLN